MRKLSGFIAVLPLIFSFILSYFQVTPIDYGEELRFNQNGEFNILVLPGLLEGERGFSAQTRNYINSIIAVSEPDLVVLGGNNIIPQPLIADLFLAYTMNIIDEYVSVFEENEVRFTVIFGDYDTKGLYDKSSQLKRYMRSEYFVGGIANSQNLNTLYNRRRNISGNFRISLLSYGNQAFYLYVIDYQNGGEIAEEQINWFQNPLNLPSLVFSFNHLFVEREDGYNFILYDENVIGYVSSEEPLNADFITIENPSILRAGQSALYSEGNITREYKAKKIVLTAEGGLSVINY